jgi:hypothetical protein
MNAAISANKRMPAADGGGGRGDNSAPRSPLFEGRFGRMFRGLPSAELTCLVSSDHSLLENGCAYQKRRTC